MPRLACAPSRRRCAGGVRRLAAAVGLAAALLAPAGASSDGPALMREIADAALDDPKAAIVLVRQQLASAGSDDSAFWRRLALVEVLAHTDNEAASREELERATQLLPAGPEARRHRLWLDFYTRYVDSAGAAHKDFRAQQALAREQARAAGDEALLCRLDLHDAVVQVELDAVDEAWAALEAVDRCATRLGDAGLRSYALGTMGPLAWRVGSQQPPQTYYERALRVLGDQPARHKRAWLLDDLGWALLNGGQPAAARSPFEQVLALASAIGDVSFMMRGHEGLAEVALKKQQGADALRHARAALALAAGQPGLRFREVTAQTQVVEALALLQQPGLAAEIDRLLAMASRDPSPRSAALIARSAARGYSALGQHATAYAELERHLELAHTDTRAARERDAQRLQARYEATRREAENLELRHAAELARLELQAQAERQRALWALLAAVGALLATGGGIFARAFRRRRRLAELAMRDELTGLPNRRAVTAFAREQLNLSRRLELPMSVALIDLDHFKSVNDRWGHAAGDRVLEAFAAAARQVVRGQDRIGRWGGEEWLLVMPGTGADEGPAVFGRLRLAFAAQHVPGLPHPHGVTFSMGVAERQPAIDGLEALIAEADRHLYRAKSQGRDALCGSAMGMVPAAEATLTRVA